MFVYNKDIKYKNPHFKITMEDADQGTFNLALHHVNELWAIQRELHQLRIDPDIERHKNVLECFYMAMLPWMKETEEKEHEKKHDDIVAEFKKYKDAKLAGRKTISTPILSMFFIWERELRRLMKSKGLLMPTKDDPSYAIGGKHY